MSGNTTNAAVSLAGSDQLKGLILLSTTLVFVLGNFFGELAALASRRRATAVVLACAAVFLLLAAGRGTTILNISLWRARSSRWGR